MCRWHLHNRVNSGLPSDSEGEVCGKRGGTVRV